MSKKVQTAVYIKLCAIAIYLVIGNFTYFLLLVFWEIKVKNQILLQAGTAVPAQANIISLQVLSLFG